jgi:uncharacterized membrane protein YhaH (DUF805 family)/Tfp pilus assembly protein PilE
MAQASNPYETPKAAVAEAAGETQAVKLFSISGRIGRARYIAYGIGLYLLLSLIGGILAAVLGTAGVVAVVLAWLAILVLGFMLTIQRCHDFDTSGWLSILMLVPLVNLIFWFIPGTDGPNRYGQPTPPNSTLVIVGVCVVPLMVVFVGILAAVAIPAYGDYTHRARISEVILSASPWRTAIDEYYAETRKLPASAADLRRDAVPAEGATKYGNVSLGANGVLTLTMSAQTGAMADKTIVLRPDVTGGAIRWDCTAGTLQAKYRPASCRAQ